MPEINPSDSSREDDGSNTTEEQMLEKGKAIEKLKKDTQIDAPKWVNNSGDEVKEVFGFNKSAELVNARAAMFGFIMLIFTELIFGGLPVTKTIFGIG